MGGGDRTVDTILGRLLSVHYRSRNRFDIDTYVSIKGRHREPSFIQRGNISVTTKRLLDFVRSGTGGHPRVRPLNSRRVEMAQNEHNPGA